MLKFSFPSKSQTKEAQAGSLMELDQTERDQTDETILLGQMGPTDIERGQIPGHHFLVVIQGSYMVSYKS